MCRAYMSLCEYRHALGVEGKGVHSWRVFNIAVVDVLLTVLAAWGIAWFFSWNFGWTLFGLFLLGIVLHRLFCVRTTIDKFLFPR